MSSRSVRGGNSGGKPVGAGPYKFVSSTPGVDLVMEAFEGYWAQGAGRKAAGVSVATEVDDAAGDAAGATRSISPTIVDVPGLNR